MANIWSILHGQPSYRALAAMPIGELMQWHERAVARAPKDKG